MVLTVHTALREASIMTPTMVNGVSSCTENELSFLACWTNKLKARKKRCFLPQTILPFPCSRDTVIPSPQANSTGMPRTDSSIFKRGATSFNPGRNASGKSTKCSFMFFSFCLLYNAGSGILGIYSETGTGEVQTRLFQFFQVVKFPV